MEGEGKGGCLMPPVLDYETMEEKLKEVNDFIQKEDYPVAILLLTEFRDSVNHILVNLENWEKLKEKRIKEVT
jgi:hypothetical protein